MEQLYLNIKGEKMETNKIIVWTSPIAPFQKIYVIKNGDMVDQVGVQFDDLEDVIVAMCQKYSITQIDFSGTHSYGKRVGDSLEANNVTKYGLAFDIQYI
jgi:hypothetical protein